MVRETTSHGALREPRELAAIDRFREAEAAFSGAPRL